MSTGTANATSNACFYSLTPENITIKYPIRAKCYVVKDSLHGLLTPITIKKYHITCGIKTFGKVVVLYVDTFNWLWNECELCDRNTAVQNAIEYYEYLLSLNGSC